MNRRPNIAPLIPLREVASVVSGTSFPNEYQGFVEGEIPFFKVGDMNSVGNERDLTTANNYISRDVAVQLKAKVHPAGTIVFPKIGAAIATNKKRRLVAASCFDNNVMGVSVGPRLDQDYFFHLIGSIDLMSFANRGNPPSIRKSSVESWEIPLPPLSEQKRIARILDQADALRAKRREAIKQLDALVQSVFLDMFGDPVTNPKGFPGRRLSEFYADPKTGTRCGPFGSALKNHELVDAGIPVWNMDNITLEGTMQMPFRMWVTPSKFRELASYSVEDGDVLISRAGTVGKMCVARMNGKPSIMSTNLIRLRLNTNLLPDYFVSLMTYCKGRIGRLKVGPDGALTHMSTKVLDTLEFPYPPLRLQAQFFDYTNSIGGDKAKMVLHRRETDDLFSSLQSRAFKGEL